MHMYKDSLTGFFNFIRERGIITLAIGFIIGGAVTKLVTSFVNDIINPLLGIVLGYTGGLTKITIYFFSAQVKVGSFISSLIDFIIIALVVYFGAKGLGIEKLDSKIDTKTIKK